MPRCNGQLAGQQCRSCLVSLVADFEKVAALDVGERSHGPVVDDQHIDPAESVEQFAVASVDTCSGKITKQLGCLDKQGGVAVAAGFLAERTSHPGLADAGRTSYIMHIISKP